MVPMCESGKQRHVEPAPPLQPFHQNHRQGVIFDIVYFPASTIVSKPPKIMRLPSNGMPSPGCILRVGHDLFVAFIAHRLGRPDDP